MLLTNKEREKLHKAMIAYLTKNSFTDAAEALSEQTGLSFEQESVDLLEKKWSSVVRLQQKVMSLQSELSQLKEDMTYIGPGKKLSEGRGVDGIPRAPAKHRLEGHRDPVTCVAFHPVYSILASSSEDGSILLWDYESGARERSLRGHTAVVNCVSFEPKTGRVIASCSADLSIKLWNFETFECVKTLHGHDHNVSHVCFLPAGDFLLTCSRDKTIKLWEVDSGYCIRTFAGHRDWVRQVAVNEAGNLLASCSADEDVLVWNLENTSPIQVLAGHSHVVECVTFASNEARVALVPKEQEEAKLEVKEVIATGSRDKTIRVWDCVRGTCLMVLSGHENWVRQLAFMPDGKYLYSASDDKSLRVWDLATRGCTKKVFDAHAHFVLCLAVNPRYPMLASGSVDKSVKVWECR